MCGRAACTLEPEDIMARVQANKILNRQNLRPVFNATSGSCLPTILNQNTINNINNNNNNQHQNRNIIVMPMIWGGIGDPSYNIINTRIDTIKSNNFFKGLFKKNRCLVACDGYYEWKRSSSSSTPLPFFIHIPKGDFCFDNNNNSQDSSTNQNICHDEDDFFESTPSPSSSSSTPTSEESSRKPMMMLLAAIYQVVKNRNGNDEFRYSILTTESKGVLADIHHRMPIVLNDQESIDKYLSKNDNFDDIYKVVSQNGYSNLSSYRVSTFVNNTKNNTPDCLKPEKEYSNSNGIGRFFQPATQPSISSSMNSTFERTPEFNKSEITHVPETKMDSDQEMDEFFNDDDDDIIPPTDVIFNTYQSNNDDNDNITSPTTSFNNNNSIISTTLNNNNNSQQSSTSSSLSLPPTIVMGKSSSTIPKKSTIISSTSSIKKSP
eukprot:gene2600-3223_t